MITTVAPDESRPLPLPTLRGSQETNEDLLLCAIVNRADLLDGQVDRIGGDLFTDDLRRTLALEAAEQIRKSGTCSPRLVAEAAVADGRFTKRQVEEYLQRLDSEWPPEALSRYWVDDALAVLVNRVQTLALDRALSKAQSQLQSPDVLAADVAVSLRHSVSEIQPTAIGTASRSFLPWRRFPVKALPEPVSTYVAEAAAAIGCDVTYIALPVLAVMASVIGTTRRIHLKRTWAEFPIVWAIIVGVSGTIKSPALELVLAYLRRLQAKAMQEHAEMMATYERDMLDYKVVLKEWERTGRKSEKEPPTKPELPICRRLLCSDVTVEGLAPILANTPRGLLLNRDELAAWLNSFDGYKGTRGSDVAHWLELHRAGPLLIDRKTGDPKNIYVPRAALSIVGSIQPKTLTRALGQEHFENGLAARMLMAMPPKVRKRWTEADLPRLIEAAFERVIDRLLTLNHNVDQDGQPVPVDVPLSPAGKAAWVAFYKDHARAEAEMADENLEAAYSKTEAYAARFALIVHFIRWAADDPTLTDAIDERSVDAGATLARWFCHETERIYSALRETDEQAGQRRRVESIQRKGGQVTVREWQRTRSHKTASDSEAELAGLVKAGLGAWKYPKPGPAGGAPSKLFQLTTSSDTDRTPTADGANGGIVGVSGVSATAAQPAEVKSWML